MTNEETLAYINNEFDVMRGLAIKGGQLSPGMYAVLKMVFIAGMAAALSYDGDDETLGRMVKVALANISKRHGGRTIFPIEPLEETNDAPIITDEQKRQKDLAFSLVGLPLRFNHQDESAPWLFIESIGFEGMVTLREGYVGEFAPHLFKVVEAKTK